jgi:hypothetical protein
LWWHASEAVRSDQDELVSCVVTYDHARRAPFWGSSATRGAASSSLTDRARAGSADGYARLTVGGVAVNNAQFWKHELFRESSRFREAVEAEGIDCLVERRLR